MSSLVIDSREKGLIDYFSSASVQQLSVGDLHIFLNETLHYIIERKTLTDLAASIKDGRLKEQKSRLSQFDSKNIIYIIEGSLNTTFPNLKVSGIPTTTLQTCILQLSLQHHFTVLQTDDLDNTCQIIDKILQKAERFCSKTNENERFIATILQNSCKQKSKEISFVSMLCQIPGISIKIGTKIAEQYRSMSALCQELSTANEEPVSQLRDIIISTNETTQRHRRLGPVLSKRIYEYLRL